MKILVVDDEPDIEFLFQQKFKKKIASHILMFYYAHSGEEALKLLEEEVHTNLLLILSDINMPGMSGIDLLKVVKEKYPNIRVVMITAYGNDVNTQKAWEWGAEEIISKPINFDYLENLLMEYKQLQENKN